MSYRRIVPFFLVLKVSAHPRPALAFDPYTVAMGAQAVSGVMSGMKEAGEVADAGFAFGDLLSELDVEHSSDDEMREAVIGLENLSSKARDLKWNKDEVKNALETDLTQANSLRDRMRALKSMIVASKRIAAIMGVRSQTGQKAAQIQEIRINSMILDELQAMRRTQFLTYLEDRESKVSRSIYMQEIVDQERSSLKVNTNQKMKVGKR